MTRADGFNGDTMSYIPKTYYDAATSIYKPIAMEAEGGTTNPAELNYITMGWGEGKWVASQEGAVNDIPAVDVPKWLSNGKHMTVWSDRYAGSYVARDQQQISDAAGTKIPAIQLQYFNGQCESNDSFTWTIF